MSVGSKRPRAESPSDTTSLPPPPATSKSLPSIDETRSDLPSPLWERFSSKPLLMLPERLAVEANEVDEIIKTFLGLWSRLGAGTFGLASDGPSGAETLELEARIGRFCDDGKRVAPEASEKQSVRVITPKMQRYTPDMTVRIDEFLAVQSTFDLLRERFDSKVHKSDEVKLLNSDTIDYPVEAARTAAVKGMTAPKLRLSKDTASGKVLEVMEKRRVFVLDVCCEGAAADVRLVLNTERQLPAATTESLVKRLSHVPSRTIRRKLRESYVFGPMRIDMTEVTELEEGKPIDLDAESKNAVFEVEIEREVKKEMQTEEGRALAVRSLIHNALALAYGLPRLQKGSTDQQTSSEGAKALD